MARETQLFLNEQGKSIGISRTAGRSQSRITIYEGGRRQGELSLLHSDFEHPLLFLAGSKADQLICVYDFDVGLRLLVIDTTFLDRSQEFGDQELRKIVGHSDFRIRLGKQADLDFVRETLERASPAKVKTWSIPTSSWAGLKTYPDRQAVIKRLIEFQESRRGDGSRLIDE